MADTSVIKWVEIITVMDIVSTKMTNIIATNITSTASINCQSKKVRDCYLFLHSFISNHNTIDNYYYLLSLCKNKPKIKDIKKLTI